MSGSGTVTSVGLNVPSSDFTLTGSPITTAGTFALGWTVAPTIAETPNAIVKRDGIGGFRAGPIVALAQPAVPGVLGYNRNSAQGATALEGQDANAGGGFYTVGVRGDTANPVGIAVLGTTGVLSKVGQGELGAVSAEVGGDSNSGPAILATTDTNNGIQTSSTSGTALYAITRTGNAVYAVTNDLTTTNPTMFAFDQGEGNAIYATNFPGTGASATNATMLLQNTSSSSHYVLYAEDGSGTNYVRTSSVGDLAATGAIIGAVKNFKIDHPMDPTNKYLMHSSIESPDMKNLYDGVVVLDSNGGASVELPSYFEALNKDFRYQLTSIGVPGPNLYVADEVSGNRFLIAGGQPGARVSWQVTGIRHDAWANANRSAVEVEKTEAEKGLYLHPEAFGEPIEKSVSYNGGAARRKSLDIRGKRSRQTSGGELAAPIPALR